MSMGMILTALGMGLVWGIMAIGVYVTYRVLNFADLTAEGSFTLGAAVAARLIIFSNLEPVTSTLLAVVVGMMAGLATGFLHTVLRIPPLLSGILSMTGLYSINLMVMNNAANIPLPIMNRPETVISRMAGMLSTDGRSALLVLSCLFLLIIVYLVWLFFNMNRTNTYLKRLIAREKSHKIIVYFIFIGVLITITGFFLAIIFNESAMDRMAAWFPASERVASIFVGFSFVTIVIFILKLFFNTEIGYVLRATGDNESMAKAQGVNTKNMKILGLMLGNACVALSGALVFQVQGFADIGMGVGIIVIGLASVIIGEVVFSKKNSNMVFIAVVLGSILYRFIIALVLSIGIHPNVFRLISALTLVLALSVPLIREKLKINLSKLVLGRG